MFDSNISDDESGTPGPAESLSRIRWRPQPKKILPIIGMLSSRYSLGDGFSDALAGFTVGLSAIPQGIAFASIAGLPLQHGLYSSFMGCFVYTLFGTVPAITIGPTTLMALMVQKSVSIHPGYAPLLALANGIIVLTCGFLRLGFLVDFVSSPVISAYTSAASITIASTQLKSLFGIKVTNKSSLPGILKTFEELFTNFHSLRWQDTTLGICCIVILTILKEIPSSKCLLNIRRERARDLARKSSWLLSIGRNAIVVLVCASIAYGVDGGEEVLNPTFILTGDIVAGLPQFQLPLFGINRTETITDPTAGQIISSLGTLLATLPMISILTQVAIARAFSKSTLVDATQEMIALGVSNLAGSFFLSMPTCASFGRTAVNSASGVKTTLGGLVTGTVVLLSLVVLMPYCAFIPATSLAALIICAVVYSIEYEIVLPLWRSKRIDLIPALLTLFSCIFWSVEYGIIVGIASNLVLVLYHTSRPKISSKVKLVEDGGDCQLWIKIDHGWTYTATGHIRNSIDWIVANQKDLTPERAVLVLDFSNINYLDFTAANAIKDLISHHQKNQYRVILFRLDKSLRPVVEFCSNRPFKLDYVDSMEKLTSSNIVRID